jgi:acyl carrier protein
MRRTTVGSEAKIIELLTSKYDVDADLITPDVKLVDLGLNSLTMAELLYDIEDTFGLEIAMSGVDMETFGEAVALVDRLVESKGT